MIAAGSNWKYLDNGSNQGTNWAQRGYNDGPWLAGPAELGYGDTADGRPEATVVGYGPNSNNKFITTYFRRWFTVPDNAVVTNLDFRLMRDDGAVVWLNGVEVFRQNMPGGTILYTTPASTSVGGTDEATYFPANIATALVVPGTNLVAVEIHQNTAVSSDISFDLELTASGYFAEPPAPMLGIVNSGVDLTISWPASATGYSLYSTLSLEPPVSWQPVSASISLIGGMKIVNLTPANSSEFYRLSKP